MARTRKGENLPMEAAPLKGERQDEDALLRLARERMVYASGEWQQNFNLSEDDVLFVEGENQWDPAALASRKDRPCLTLNTLPTFVERVFGEARRNRPAIGVTPSDVAGSGQRFQVTADDGSMSSMSAAEVMEGIVRSIEYASRAKIHYDAATGHAIDGAFGWLRVLTRYANSKDFDQELLIKRVKNRWSVLMDPDAEEPDFSDARFSFIVQDMERTEFDRRYPDALIGDLSELPESHRLAWGLLEKVRVAEYFTREAIERDLILFSNNQTAYRDQVADLLRGDVLLGSEATSEDGQPVRVMRSRKVVTWCVYWRKITAWSVLEGPVKLPFSRIPVVPVLGRERNFRDGSTVYSSLIRHAKDAKRMENYWLSSATEAVALAPKAPWVGHIGAVEGFKNVWDAANTGNPSFLPVNDGAEIPQRIEPPRMPVAEVQLAAMMVDRVKSTIGIYDASLGERSNETSRVAINARDEQSSTVTATFADNRDLAVERIGMLLIEAIPKIYDTDRVLRLLGEDGKGTWIRVNQPVPVLDEQGQPVIDPKTLRPMEKIVNGLDMGEFSVAVSAGPSYATQREKAANMLLEMTRAAPALLPVVSDKMVENSGMPQARQMAERLRRSMDQKVLTVEERAELENAGPIDPQTGQPVQKPPSPEEQAQQMMMQVEQMKAQAEMAKAEAAVATAAADKAEAEARIAQVQALTAAAQPAAATPPIDGAAIRALVAEAVAQLVTMQPQQQNGGPV